MSVTAKLDMVASKALIKRETLKPYYVYILYCKNNRLYCGYCVDLTKRLIAHLTGDGGAKFTKAFPVQSLAAAWVIQDNKRLALKLEYAIKQLTKRCKERLIAGSLIEDILPNIENGAAAQRIPQAKLATIWYDAVSSNKESINP